MGVQRASRKPIPNPNIPYPSSSSIGFAMHNAFISITQDMEEIELYLKQTAYAEAHERVSDKRSLDIMHHLDCTLKSHNSGHAIFMEDDLPKSSEAKELMIEELKWLKAPSYSELLDEDLLRKLYFKGLTFSRDELKGLIGVEPPRKKKKEKKRRIILPSYPTILCEAVMAKATIAKAVEQIDNQRKKKHIAPSFEVVEITMADILLAKGGPLEPTGVPIESALPDAPQAPIGSSVLAAKAYLKILEELVLLVDKKKLLA
ncbi:hypothetical protein COCNU_07G014160 [Cocos nucifera]|uniref:Uncharacterized protein n=1 Tax=Cocos nucifera TaxID=13894 RepID=A0A8K0IGZ3_COCNU|nr:hypothetical protein COCNU_07G014160 [Cocos nucifera]